MDRKKYWNESYLAYWRDRVAETGETGSKSSVIRGDAKTEGDEIYEKIFSDQPFRPGRILDVGCAWGRMFEMFKAHDLRISGIDISSAMIAMAEKEWKQDPKIETLAEAEAEALPFPNSWFENLCCLAVFDATFQDRALAEFMRVLKPRGLLYLTGKNTHYAPDDQLALSAEKGARGKGHPNFFTDVASMLDQLEQNGHQIVREYYFPRRGDFSEFTCTNSPPDNFYEYLLVVERGATSGTFTPFCSEFSETFLANETNKT